MFTFQQYFSLSPLISVSIKTTLLHKKDKDLTKNREEGAVRGGEREGERDPEVEGSSLGGRHKKPEHAGSLPICLRYKVRSPVKRRMLRWSLEISWGK